ncbi:MAG: DoxX family protein [Cyanobacteriota bacterium]|nr:DoxX family protein [Cyanobacteriota bacterium]
MKDSLLISKFQYYSVWALRITIVAIFLYHGLPKAIYWNAAMEKFVSFGLPGFLGPITGIAEVIASVLLLSSRFWKIANYILLFIIAGAIVTVQLPAYIEDIKKVAGLERDLLILVGHIVLLSFDPKLIFARPSVSDSVMPQ